MTGISVVIVDDHRMTAFSLGDSLSSRGIVISAIHHSASEGIDAVKQGPCSPGSEVPIIGQPLLFAAVPAGFVSRALDA